MPSLDEQLDALLLQPLSAADARPALGYVGLDIPPDLLLAVPGRSVHLPWQLGRQTPHADRWLESSFPLWARSMLEDWAQGRFDALGHVLFTRGEDVSQRLYYYVCELQRRGKLSGPTPLIFDIARIDRPSSHRYTEAALRSLASTLGLTRAALQHGIGQANDLRARFAQLREGPRVSGSLCEKLVRASLFAEVAPLIGAARGAPRGTVRGRVLLAGSSPPDARIHELIESCGWQVAAELYDRNLERLGGEVEIDSPDAVQAIARHWLQHKFLGRELTGIEPRVLRQLRESRADAVVLWFARDDEALAWQVPRMRAVVAASGIRYLLLSAADWGFADGAAAQIQNFLQGQTP